MVAKRHIYILIVLALMHVLGCTSKHTYKGSGAERIDEFSRVDESFEEKHLEDTGKPEYIK
ncbi:MAG: hypothetical protein GF409_07850 [Candidatus Omnitrophica bacterium]|nr:hypothetical protein [Candidatus Omnitrophota bacterium]